MTPPNTKSLEEAKKFHCSRRRDCPKCIVILGKVAVWLLKFSFLFVAILQLLSAMTHGTGAQNYKPSDADNFLEWTVPGGKVQKASYRCQGNSIRKLE